MECPQCGSENVYETKRRGLEKIIGAFSSKQPFQCKECWARFMKSGTDGKGKQSSRLYIIIFLLIMIPLLWYKFFRTPEPDVQIARKPPAKTVQTVSKPEPAAVPADTAATEPESAAITDSSGADPLTVAKPVEASVEESGQEEPETLIAGATESAVPADALPADAKTETAGADPVSQETTGDAAIADPASSDPVTERAVKILEPASVKILEPASEEKKSEVKTSGIQTRRSASEKPRLIRQIVTEETDGELKISVSSDQPITKYKRFYMHEPPPRLVLNIYGDWTYSGPGEIGISSGMVDKIRIGRHDGYVSIVLDLNLKEPIHPKIVKSDDGLVLTVKKAG